MLKNPVLGESISDLKVAYKKSKAPIWLRLREMMERSGSKAEVNLSRLSRVTGEGDVVVVPGKILGTGALDHKVTVCAFSISQSAARKIIDAGGTIMGPRKFIEKYPDGNKVKIIG
jgi:large subunit ribosomal protein L18e